MECKCFRKKSRFDFQANAEKIKDYGEVNNAVYRDHVYCSLWQCPKCGALFLHEEAERIDWSGGNDFFTDTFYQVESLAQADELVEEGDLMFNHKGNRWCV